MTEGTPPAVEPRVSSRSETRGFLFADIRGYTEYVERKGAAAAADLLLRYRAVVRDAITRNEGAEIRTEGDSFYVVLRSASDAVLCGMAIVKGVAEENARVPGAPIRVGVGVHAGEAIDTAEGLVGSAVNVAARVCALAGPGEVLVTEMVRGLARNVVPVTFVPRGRHRLKGVAETIELFRVAESEGRSSGRAITTRSPWLIAGALLGVVLVGGLGISLVSAFSSPATSVAPTPTGPFASAAQTPPTTTSTTTTSFGSSAAPRRRRPD